MTSPAISRRALLVSSAAALAGCSRQKATSFRGFCFVANQAGRSIGVVDLVRFRLRKQIPLDAEPTEVVRHPNDFKVFVLAPEAGTVYEIDAVQLAVTRRAKAGTSALGMQLAPDGKALWILYREPAALIEMPLDSLRPGRRIKLTSPPSGFDLSSQRDRIAISSSADHTVALASTVTAAIERTITTADEPSLIDFRSDGRHLLAASAPQRSLAMFDAATGQTIVRLPLPLEPRHMTTSADGGQVFLTGAGMDAVVVVYPYRTEIAETILAGRAPEAMAVTDTPPYLFITNPETDSITVLDFSNMGKKLVATAQVGREPRHILITPKRPGQDQYALVLNEKSGDMAVLRLASMFAQEADPGRRYRPKPLFTMIAVGEKPVSAAIVEFA